MRLPVILMPEGDDDQENPANLCGHWTFDNQLRGEACPFAPTSTFRPPTPTQETYLSYPKTTTIAETEIYAGPGNLDYEVLATVSAGTEVYTLGVFGDFVKVQDPLDKLEGFVRKANLKEIAPDLMVLTSDEVPWIEEDFIAKNCLGPFTSIDDSQIATINDYTPGPGGYQLQGAPIELGDQTQITIHMESDNDRTVWIGMSDQPFRNYGEWYLGYRTITIFKNYAGFNGYSIEFRDGLKPDAITIPLIKLGDVAFTLVFLDSTGKIVEIRDLSGNTLYHFSIPGISYEGTSLSLPQGLFPDQKLYLSCASDGPTSISFSEHTMRRVPKGAWKESQVEIPSLRILAQELGIEITIPHEGWRMGDERYARFQQQHISMVNLGETGTPNFWLGKDHYNFEYLDKLIDSIVDGEQKILASIVYGPAPETVPEDIRSGNFTKEEYREILHDYVNTVVCRYKDKVSVWSIANESVGAIVVNAYDFWAEKVGPEYIDLAFQWASDCDPDGILLLNDSINDSRRDEFTTQYVDAMLVTIKRSEIKRNSN